MKSRPATLRLSECDAILVSGHVNVISEVNEFFIKIHPIQNPGETMSLTHQEVADHLETGQFTLQYGYFSDRQAARRAMAGRALVTRLPNKTQLEVFWKECWCTTFEELEADGKVNRSAKRWHEFLPLLEHAVREKHEQGLSKAAPGAVFDSVQLRRTPCRTSVMGWLRSWEKMRDPAVFIKKSCFNGANAKRISPEAEAIVEEFLPSYQHNNQLRATQLHQDVNADIRKRNELRKDVNHGHIQQVSLSTIGRRIGGLHAFETLAAREGIGTAKNKFGAYGRGVQVSAPLQRIEIDEWEIDLIAILKSGGVDVSGPAFRDLETGRYWICVAMDAASRCILGIKLSRKPSVEDAKAVLLMAMQDKTKLARQLGCEMNWDQYGHIYHVVVDNGPAFVASEFKAVLADLCIDYSVLPAGEPKLRARVERIFRTLVTMLMPRLTGRTFSNTVERGDYPSQKYAVHTAQSLIELLTRFTVDFYHNKSHRGLQYASPNNTWSRLITKYGWAHPRSQHQLRHVLGIPYTRETGRHGVWMSGVNYHSNRLAQHFLRYGQQSVDVRVDAENMGHISIWLPAGADSGWSTLTSQQRGLEGVSFAEWEHTIAELRRGNRDAAALSQGVIDRAIERIKEIDTQQCAFRQLGPIGDNKAKIERAQKQVFWGLSLGNEPEHGPSASEETTGGGILSNEILPDQDPAEQSENAPSQAEHAQPQTWSFYTEEDDDEDENPIRGDEDGDQK